MLGNLFKSKPVAAMLERLEAEAVADATSERAALVKRLAEVEAAEVALLPVHDAAIDTCRDEVAKAESALQAAKSRLQAATSDKLRASYPLTREAEQLRARLEQDLRPVCISDALQRIEDLREKNRRAAIEVDERRQQLALLRWCADAREQLLALQFIEADTDATVAKILAGQPAV